MTLRFISQFAKRRQIDCASIGPLLSLYTDRMASAAEVTRVEGHLQTCAGCRQALNWMQATHQAISMRPVALPPADLHARIARAIAAAEATHSPQPVSAPRVTKLRPAMGYGLSLAVFAAVSGVMLWHISEPQITVAPVAPAHAPATIVATKPSSSIHTLPSLAHAPFGRSQAEVHHQAAAVADRPVHTPRIGRLSAAPTSVRVPETIASRTPSFPMMGAEVKTASSPVLVRHHSVVHAVPNTNIIADRSKAITITRPAPLVVLKPDHPQSAPQDMASRPALPFEAPSAPMTIHVGSPAISPDRPSASVASFTYSVNHNLRSMALALDTGKTLTVHSIALTRHNVESRFSESQLDEDTTDASGTVAITAGPVH